MSLGVLSGLQVLIVDDHDPTRALVIELLRSVGVRGFLQASDGFGAIDVISSHEIDLVITDALMQPMDGLTFVQVVRQAGSTVPIILMTAHATLAVLGSARDAGVTEFLAKPLTARSFLSRLNAVIHHPRPFVRTADYFGPCRRRKPDSSYAGPERRGAAVGYGGDVY